MVVTLPPALMNRDGRWYVRAWHHCRQASTLPSQSAPADEGPSDRPVRQLMVCSKFLSALCQQSEMIATAQGAWRWRKGDSTSGVAGE